MPYIKLAILEIFILCLNFLLRWTISKMLKSRRISYDVILDISLTYFQLFHRMCALARLSFNNKATVYNEKWTFYSPIFRHFS